MGKKEKKKKKHPSFYVIDQLDFFSLLPQICCYVTNLNFGSDRVGSHGSQIGPVFSPVVFGFVRSCSGRVAWASIRTGCFSGRLRLPPLALVEEGRDEGLFLQRNLLVVRKDSSASSSRFSRSFCLHCISSLFLFRGELLQRRIWACFEFFQRI